MKAKGQIIDKITQEPLPRASVIITDNSGEIIDESKRATANDEGIFEIDVFPSDYLVISYVGYKNAKISINDFSSDIKVIPLTYIKSGEQTSDLFKEGRDENAQDKILSNKPLKWYYWVGFGLIGFYIYKKIIKK